MLTYDGVGYGSNLSWHYKAIAIAKENQERCEHLDINSISLDIINVQKEKYRNLGFKLKCVHCDQSFEKTQKLLRNKFLEFYGLK